MTNLNPNVAIKIQETLNQTELSKRTQWRIYRVPNDIRRHNKVAYTPQVVSLGPFHFGTERLQRVQTYKWEYFKDFVEKNGIDLGELVSFIGGLEPKVRLSYSEKIVSDKKELIEIILLDACFIIELFWRDYRENLPRHDPRYKKRSEDDPLSSDSRVADNVHMDLLLLENQLPFFVLQELFNNIFPPSEVPFLELTFQYFRGYNKQKLNWEDGVTISHFTDLLRYFHLQHPSNKRPERNDRDKKLNFNVTKLHEAGLRFKVNDTSQCLLGLHFSGRDLQIPNFQVDDGTEVLFHNMVAFEQCHYPYEAFITDYVTIFDWLIDTDKDVDILVQNGIITNCLDSSGAVAQMFNGLAKGVILADFNSNYLLICQQLNDFCKNPCEKLKATLRRDYCHTPWRTAASIAGILLLLLTLVQTIFSGIQVMQQPKNG